MRGVHQQGNSNLIFENAVLTAWEDVTVFQLLLVNFWTYPVLKELFLACMMTCKTKVWINGNRL